MPTSDKLDRFTPRQLRGLMAMLVVQFILGVSLTTVINYDPYKHTTVQNWFIVLHMLVAIGLLIGSIARLVIALKARDLQIASLIGLFAIIVAIVNGIIAANTGANAAVLIMALSFLAAFMTYGYSLGQVMHR